MARTYQHPLTPSHSPSRTASVTSLSSPTPKPLRIFKRTSRNFNFQHLTPDAPFSTVKEPQPRDLRHISFSSIDCQISPADPFVGGNSSLTLLPTPPPTPPLSHAGDDDDDSDDGTNENVDDEPPRDGADDRVPLVRKPTPATAPSVAIGHLKRKASNAAAASLDNSTVHHRCALCKDPLPSALKTYAFPRTAPAVLTALRSLYPDLEIPVDGLLPSSRKPTPIRTTAAPVYGIKQRALTPFPFTSPVFNNNNANTTITLPLNAPSGRAMGGTTSWLGLPRPRSPEFCLTCFEQLHALHICWTCGETVERTEERVGCGWAWWHWGCMACLLCRAPISPPAWTADPITLSEPPACRACLRELRELVAMERRKISDCRRRRCYSSVPGIDDDDDDGIAVVPSASSVTAAVTAAAAPYHPRRHFLPPVTANATAAADTAVYNDHDEEEEDTTGSSTVRASGARPRAKGGRRRGGGVSIPPLPRAVEIEVFGAAGTGAGMGKPKGTTYPPLPKWMDKLPGRRSGGGTSGTTTIGGGGGVVEAAVVMVGR